MDVQPPQCARHGEVTRLSCAECGEPLCPKCGVRTSVGLKCERCARPPSNATAAGSPRWRRLRLPAALAVLAVLVAVAATLGVALTRGSAPAPATGVGATVGRWSKVPDVPGIRGTATATVLRDGSVLVAGGGVGAVPLAAAARYDPMSGTWTVTGKLNQARRGHRAVRLPDGRVLVAGGIAGKRVLASAEIYDPSSGQWTATGSMTVPRLGFTLTKLPGGKVLAAGGTSGGESGVAPLASAEIYDPSTGRWTATASMTAARYRQVAVALPDGRVLLAGGLGSSGDPLASAEIYDPAARTFVRAAAMADARAGHRAVMLTSGSVFVVGGVGGEGGSVSLASAEVFDPARNDWSTVSPMSRSRDRASATLLPDGRVLVAGGQSVHGGTYTALASAEVFDPRTGRWRSAGRMACPRSGHAAVRLGDGSVLVVAGDAAFPGKAPVASNCAARYRP